MEYFDILDDKGALTGKVKARHEVHRDGDWHRAANLWLINGRGEILLQRRSLMKESFAGLWDLSCAGHVQAGSNSRETIMREAEEELGVRILAEELVLLTTIQERFVLNEGKYHDNEFRDIYLVRKDLEISDCRLQVEEVAEVKWMALKDFRLDLGVNPHLYTPHDREYEVAFARYVWPEKSM